ncbi:DUF2752 domain-containing protein [uncultured Pedobacter sp.]|uniref:DUF2752 domain-containing protein n=1 Tax=Pedobacter sp. UBA4863 TaxID=1947060 RepID=UPI003458C8F0
MTKRSKIFKTKEFLTAKAIALAVFPLVLIVLPASYFDTGKSICLFTLLTDIPCYGCGLTRACMHLIHFNFEMAANFNKISFVVFPILCFLYLQEFVSTLKGIGVYQYVFTKKNES